MYLVATFRYCKELELAVHDLRQEGIGTSSVAAVPLDWQEAPQPRILDTIHRWDGVSLLDGPAVLGTICAVLGASFGFNWKLGPILWGLIGLAFGAAVGFAVDRFLHRKQRKKNKRNSGIGHVVLIIYCASDQVTQVRRILRRRLALAIGQWG